MDILKAKWYVIHTNSGSEYKVKKNLENRVELLGKKDCIFEVLVPEENAERVQDGERVSQSRKIYPGYVLVLHDKEVQTVLRSAGIGPQRSAAMTPIGFTEGQTVKIIDGPFTDFIGVIKEISQEKRKAKVLVFIFGRDTAIEVDLIQLEEA